MASGNGTGPGLSTASKTIVIKLGTSSILSESTHQPKLSILSSLVETCHLLRCKGHKVVLVCSGAIGMGKVRMGMMSHEAASSSKLPILGLGERQALAALGQLRLIALWDSLFGQLGISVAQVLLTRNDIADRPRFLNAKTTLQTLLSPRFNAIPIVNENDTVSVSELRFGDNDTLSAITAGLIDADYLFLLTDVDGLYTGNPRSDPQARRLGIVEDVTRIRRLVNVASLGSNFGTGGMMTKLIAAELATAAGVATVIINGAVPGNIVKVVAQGSASVTESPRAPSGPHMSASLESSMSSLALEEEERSLMDSPPLEDPPHTLFLPLLHPLKPRKWSILHALHPAGSIVIDQGAYERIVRPDSGGRLLAAGVIGVEGTWERMQAIRIVARRRRTRTDDIDLMRDGVGPPPSTKLNAYLHGPDTLNVSPSGCTIRTSLNLSSDVLPSSDDDWELVEVGRGLANYNSMESERIKGLKSSQISTALGYADSDYIVDQLALHPSPSQPLRG